MALHWNIPRNKKWIGQIFAAKAAKNGGIVRRKVSSVKQYATVNELRAEVKARGFHMLRVEEQYLIICSSGNFRVIC